MIETNKKPRVFIGSSREAIPYVDAIHGRLRYEAEVTPWHTAFREAHAYNMEELERALNNADYAVFVFSPDDVVKIRGQIFYTARDNTLFELGLFWGKLERWRVFYLIPDKQPEQTNGEPAAGLRLATDLDGIAPLTYEVREDNNYDAAVSFPCSRIIRRIQELGPFEDPQKVIEQLEKKNTDKAHALQFLVPFSKALMEKEYNKYEVLYESLRSAFAPPARFKVSGGAVFKAADKGLAYAAGRENRETFIPYDINGGKQGEKLVADCFLNSEERVLLINDLLVKTYLICYPFKNIVATVHISGPYELNKEQLDEMFSTNQELLRIIQFLFGPPAKKVFNQDKDDHTAVFANIASHSESIVYKRKAEYKTPDYLI